LIWPQADWSHDLSQIQRCRLCHRTAERRIVNSTL